MISDEKYDRGYVVTHILGVGWVALFPVDKDYITIDGISISVGISIEGIGGVGGFLGRVVVVVYCGLDMMIVYACNDKYDE